MARGATLRSAVAATGRLSVSERIAGAQPPPAVSRILLLVVVALAVVGRLPGLLAVAVAAGTLFTVLAALWTRGVTTYLWVGGSVAVLVPVPLRPAGTIATLIALGLCVVVARLVQALSALIAAAQASALQRYGERDALDRSSRAQREDLVGQIAYWASHDRLTEVLNRSTLTRHLGDLATAGAPVGVLVLSLAGFAAINDAMGSEVGDDLLAALARRLRSHARDGDVVARLGGDEFALVLPGLTTEHALPVSMRLLQVLGDPFAVGPHLISLHARCGLALDDGSFTTGGPELMRQALQAARSASVGAAPAVYSATTQAELQADATLEAELDGAIERDEFFLLYQPLVSTASGRIESVEALVRWQHPERGLVPPDAFISAAERTGQILKIGMRVIELAVAQLRQWSSGPSSALTVAINVSVRQLAEPGFAEAVRSVIWGAGVDPHRVLLELTESLLVEDSDRAIAALWQLRGLGIRIALDDFGTGYSSLARLGELPLDELKIDKSFVDRLGVGPHDSTALVTAAIAMGQGLGLTVVAEGVESELQAAQLNQLGCDLLQGYLLGRPQPADALAPQFGQRLLADVARLPMPRTAVSTEEILVPQLMRDIGR